MKLQFKKRRLVPVALAIVVLVVGSGVAYAFWTAGGTGDGTAKAGTVSSLTVTQTGTVTGLYPGGPALPIGGTLNNPNAGAVFVTSVSATITSVILADGTTGVATTCSAADFTLAPTATVGVEISSGVTSWGHAADPFVDTMSIKLLDTGRNQDACKNATVNLLFTVL